MPVFRARQIMEWVYEKGIADPAKMSNLSKLDRDRLAADITFLSGRTVKHQIASDGTQKLLVQWDDWKKSPAELASAAATPAAPSDAATSGETRTDGPSLSLPQHAATDASCLDTSLQTECVMIPVEQDDTRNSRRTACISSQIGCPVGCRFCASGLGGLDGNLTAGRIVEQAWRLGALLKEQGDPIARITNVVFMGMGEPLANFSNVINAIRRIATLSPEGLGISARKITISTVGLPKAIERLASELELPVTLALSLHAPNDELRRKLIPWAEYTTIPDLLAACQRWFDKTGREITLEYILLGGVNDRPEHAQQLASLAKTLRANINLIRYNEVSGIEFVRPADNAVAAFQATLRSRGVNTHIRASRGRDIAAACGQLRHETAATN